MKHDLTHIPHLGREPPQPPADFTRARLCKLSIEQSYDEGAYFRFDISVSPPLATVRKGDCVIELISPHRTGQVIRLARSNERHDIAYVQWDNGHKPEIAWRGHIELQQEQLRLF